MIWYKRLKKSHKMQLILIELLFVMIAISFIGYEIFKRKMGVTNDTDFNYQRLTETCQDLLHFKLPQFNLYKSLPYGGAIASVYPWVTLAPFALISLVIKDPFSLWCAYEAIWMFIGLNIAYYAYRSIIPHDLNATIFAIAYCLSTIQISWIIASSDLGSYTSFMLAPLALFGWWHWMKNGHWKMMTIGLILMGYSHILTTIIMICSLGVLTLVFIKGTTHKMKKLFNLIKAIIVFLLAIAIVVVPLLVLVRHNLITAPNSLALIQNNNMSPVIFLNPGYIVAPYMWRVWTYSDLVCLVLVIIYWKRLSKTNKKFFIVAMIYILLNVNVIKDFLIRYTPFKDIQFMCRISFVSHMLLSIVLVQIIGNILLKRWYVQNVLSLIITLFIVMEGSVFVSIMAMDFVSHNITANQFSSISENFSATSVNRDIYLTNKVNKVVMGPDAFRCNAFQHFCSHFDYLPVNEAKHYGLTNKAMILGTKHKACNVYPGNNGRLRFKLRKPTKNMVIPMTMYHHQKYHLKLDGHLTKKWSFNNKYGSVELHHLHKGWHCVQLIAPLMRYKIITVIVSLFGWLLMCIPRIKIRKRD